MTPARCGHAPRSGLFFERLGPEGGERRPVLLVHGAGATGACWRATADGRMGWADILAEQGRECWVTDWPGTGRSGGRDPVDIGFSDLVAGYRELLREVIGRPVVVLCHSMGGAIAWQLVAHEGDLVHGVVSVAGAYPGNLPPRSEVVADDGDVLEARFGDTGVGFVIDRRRPYLYEDAYVREQAIATSRRFPDGAEGRMRAGFVGIPPRVLLQRLGIEEGLPRVDDPSRFAGVRVRLVAGSEDPAHTRAIDERTVALLREWDADAQLVWLPERGIEGNGHFPFFETNSDEVLAVVAGLLDEVAESRRGGPP